MKLFLIVALSASLLFGQVLYEEYFTGGVTSLDWHPWFAFAGYYDTMRVVSDPTTPGGDSWAGKLTNEASGGGAAAVYAGAADLDDYSIEAWIYTIVTGASGPYNGITMRMDTVDHYYYRLVSDFDSDAQLRLGVYTGGMGATVIRDWTAGEIPGGVPATSSWHKLKLMMIADSIWAFYDDVLLPDCPFIDNTLAQGYFGIYVFNMMAVDSTKCDNIIVSEPTGVAEHDTGKLTAFTVSPNPFRNTLHITFSKEHRAEGMEFKIYDATGRLLRQLNHTTIGQSNNIVWDGRDDRGSVLAPGVYFITANNVMLKVVKLR
ncbi:MAG: T9SS type A sorting domain-containing protein [candidate division WOR-3 bacterium]|nr:MAG: T9SS type A sorting domain-containing protein [candidate division WOR-3 bacterium]